MSTERELVPGGGRRIRFIYLSWLVASVFLLIAVLTIVRSYLDARGDNGEAPTVLAGCAVLLLSSAFLIPALFLGVTAVRGDRVLVTRALRSGALARLGSPAGWFGAPVPLLVGGFQYFAQDVSLAPVVGLVLGVGALIPALANDMVRRLSATLTWEDPSGSAIR